MLFFQMIRKHCGDTARNDSAPRPPTYTWRERGLINKYTKHPAKATGCLGFGQPVGAECSLPPPHDFHMLLFCGAGFNLFFNSVLSLFIVLHVCPSGRKNKRFKTYWRAMAQMHLTCTPGLQYTGCDIGQDEMLLLSRWTLFYLK